MKLGEEDREENFYHNQIIQAVNKRFEDGHQYWVFKDFVGHRKVQQKEIKSWEWPVQVLWDNDEKTLEAANVVRMDDPLSMVSMPMIMNWLRLMAGSGLRSTRTSSRGILN